MRHFLVKHVLFCVLGIYLVEVALDVGLPCFLFGIGMLLLLFVIEVVYHHFFPKSGDFPL